MLKIVSNQAAIQSQNASQPKMKQQIFVTKSHGLGMFFWLCSTLNTLELHAIPCHTMVCQWCVVIYSRNASTADANSEKQ